jgi:hypothetical protein
VKKHESFSFAIGEKQEEISANKNTVRKVNQRSIDRLMFPNVHGTAITTAAPNESQKQTSRPDPLEDAKPHK